MDKSNEEDVVKFGKLMVALSIAVGKEPSTERTDLYFNYLKDLDINDLARAVDQIIRTETFSTFPTVGKIRSMLEGDKEERIECEANEAWGKVSKLAWDHGSTGNETGDRLLDEAVRIAFGGWKHFGDTDPSYEGADRRHFINCYKGIMRKEGLSLLNPAEPKKQLEENTDE